MKKINRKSAIGHKTILAGIIPLLMATQAQGFEFYSGGVEGSFDSEISMGSSWRVEAQDEKFLVSGNEEDGNANFSKGTAFSQVLKGSHDLEVSYKNFGGFVRGKYWYDSALENNNVDYGHTPTATIGNSTSPLSVNHAGESRLDDSGFNELSKFSGAVILDAFVYGEFDVMGIPLDVRLGKQVVSWGESTFIMGGINTINPMDINGFTRPGAEIKEVLLPVNMAYTNIGLTENLSFEAFYQLEYQQSVLPGCGTFFSQADYISEGCNLVTVARGDLNVNMQRSETDKPDDDGQFGLAFRYVAEELNDTEFGVYFMNIHSRTPTGNGRKSVLDRATETENGVNAYWAGLLPFATPPVAKEDATPEQLIAGEGIGAQVAGARMITTTSYFVAYPEDLQIMGLSFASNIGSLAVSGELSYHKDMPIQINPAQLIGVTLAGSTAELAPVGMDSTILDADALPVQPGGEIQGYRRFDVSQMQFTLVKLIDRALGSDRITLIGEAAFTYVDDLAEGDNQIKFQRATFFDKPGNDGGFVTQSSWGYRALIQAEYSDVFAGVNLKPSLAWKHDVEGFAPSGASGFGEGKQSLDISVGADYLATYKASISYTQYMGGDYNIMKDRDFASISVGMQF